VQTSSDIHKIGDWARGENLAYRVSPNGNGRWTVDIIVGAVADDERLADLIMRLSGLVAQTVGKAAARNRLGERT
jgi:hypothetical protein